MPRLDVYRVPVHRRRMLVVDVQANFLDHLESRVVVPLLSTTGALGIAGVNPICEFEGETYFLQTQEIAVMTRRVLSKSLGSLAEYRDEITRALDTLFLGF